MSEGFHSTVRAALAKDDVAFESLFARSLPRLKAFIRVKAGGVVCAKESVDDLAQSVCRELLQDLDDFEYRGEEAFRNWLFVQASRKILERYRYHHRVKRDVDRERHPLDASDDSASILDCYATFCTPSRCASAREELKRVDVVLDQLPQAQRESIALAKVLGLSYPEVAAQLGRTESAVRGLVARGLATLSVMLIRES